MPHIHTHIHIRMERIVRNLVAESRKKTGNKKC